jgi:hypothetical protein
MISTALFGLATVAAVGFAQASRQVIRVSNCSDAVTCSPATCVSEIVDADRCVSLQPANFSGIIDAPFATFTCLRDPFLCTPTQAFWQDPTCATPMETLWTPCGTCMQFPPRDMHCAVLNNTYHSIVGSCSDAACKKCTQDNGDGLTAGVCWPHPGVPGLFLKFQTLEACSAIRIVGYANGTCTGQKLAETIMPGGGKCFKGLTLFCDDA